MNFFKTILLLVVFFALPKSPESIHATRAVTHTVQTLKPIHIPVVEPIIEEVAYTTVGQATYYGYEYGGRKTASGEIFNPELLTAAHKTLPFGTVVRVIRTDTKDTVVVTVNDRLPQTSSRIIDLSLGAARILDMEVKGVVSVELQIFNKKHTK